MILCDREILNITEERPMQINCFLIQLKLIVIMFNVDTTLISIPEIL